MGMRTLLTGRGLVVGARADWRRPAGRVRGTMGIAGAVVAAARRLSLTAAGRAAFEGHLAALSALTRRGSDLGALAGDGGEYPSGP